MRVATLSISAGLALGLMSGPALATDWTVTVGGRAQAVTPYEGAGHDIFVPTPSFTIRRTDGPDRPVMPDDGLGLTTLTIKLFNDGAINIGPVVRLRGSRNNDDDRVGLRDLGIAVEPGMFVNIWPTSWFRLRAEGRKGVTGHHGWIGDAGADLVARHGPWTGTIGARAGWADVHYMNAYFGVTPLEAAASPFIATAYQPTGGLRYRGLETTLAYRWSPHWQTTANFGFHRLGSIAADSPIVQTIGERDEYAGGIGLRYSFGFKH